MYEALSVGVQMACVEILSIRSSIKPKPEIGCRILSVVEQYSVLSLPAVVAV